MTRHLGSNLSLTRNSRDTLFYGSNQDVVIKSQHSAHNTEQETTTRKNIKGKTELQICFVKHNLRALYTLPMVYEFKIAFMNSK